MQTIIVTGNPIDGLTFIGPFEDESEAIDYAETNCEEWWLGELEEPESEQS